MFLGIFLVVKFIWLYKFIKTGNFILGIQLPRAPQAAGHSLVLSQGYLKKIKKGAKKVNFSQGCFTMAQGGGLKARLYHNPFSSPLGS